MCIHALWHSTLRQIWALQAEAMRTINLFLARLDSLISSMSIGLLAKGGIRCDAQSTDLSTDSHQLWHPAWTTLLACQLRSYGRHGTCKGMLFGSLYR